MPNLDDIRNIIGGPDDSSRLPTWKCDAFIGQAEFFNGNLIHKVNAVGMGPTPDSIQIVTYDTWNEETRLSRMLVVEFAQVPPILQGLLDAETRIVDLDATPVEAWPELPLVLAEAEGLKDTVKVLVDHYKGRLEIKLTKNSGGNRSKQWMKWGPNANRQLMKLILQAYDSIEAAVASADPDNGPEEGDGIPF